MRVPKEKSDFNLPKLSKKIPLPFPIVQLQAADLSLLGRSTGMRIWFRGKHFSIRQMQVLELILAGHSYVEMSKLLKITPRTIRHHSAVLFRLLKVHSRLQLTQKLFRFEFSIACTLNPDVVQFTEPKK